ncbi:uncharacterized protein LOC110033869 [Phalaenopsis equestris]|uniref:uncharacterized protein LOC110033869 n=1 Tax=Phalaenopsis equestris TaxID=78828 RepID=UPI0009E31544|nr:uncharacterized protein LOC110033869 [Phalaenopsis equestris]
MGCFISTPKDAVGYRRRPGKLGEVAVYVPGLRIPKSIDFYQPLSDSISTGLIEQLSALKTRVVVMAAQEAPIETKHFRKTATQHGGSTIADLLQALEDYLPVLLGLAIDGSELKYKVQFVWINQEDDAEETAMSDVSYEILSILHLMATLCLSEANLLLLPKAPVDVSQARTSEESRRAAIEILLRAAGYLEFAAQHVLAQIPLEKRRDLPIDLAEGKLRALCMQALAQGVDLQLGLAIDSPKATLAVKRRLACEMVKCWQQAQDHITQLPVVDGWVQKHRLFIEWKHNEAKAAAYYYHGLILDEGNTEKSHGLAVASLQAADEFLKESKKACEAFHSTPPISRNPPLWGSMKYLSEKIPKDVSSKVRINRDLYNQEKIMETAPSLPDFMIALKPDDYQLPPLDPSWGTGENNQLNL